VPKLRSLVEKYQHLQKNTYDAFINTNLASLISEGENAQSTKCFQGDKTAVYSGIFNPSPVP